MLMFHFFCWRHVSPMACVTANSCFNPFYKKKIFFSIFDSCLFVWKTKLSH